MSFREAGNWIRSVLKQESSGVPAERHAVEHPHLYMIARVHQAPPLRHVNSIVSYCAAP